MDGESNSLSDSFTLSPANVSLDNPPVELSRGVLLGIAIYLTIVGLLSTLGNILVLMTLTRWRLVRNNAHMILLLNMAACDLAISLTGYPYTTVSGYIGEWIFGNLVCTLYAFLCFTLSQVSMNTLVAVSIFRYIVMCKPHLKNFLTTRSSQTAVLLTWIHALFWTVPPLFGWSNYTFEVTGISCSIDFHDRSIGGVTYVLGTTLFCYLSHIGVMSWCYWQVFCRIRSYSLARAQCQAQAQQPRIPMRAAQALRRDQGIPTSPTVMCESAMVFSFITTCSLNPIEIHVLKMNIIMVSSFLLLWSPYAVVSCISAFTPALSPFWYIFPTLFAKTSCMMNPILYGLTNKFLRRELIAVIKDCLGLTTDIERFQARRKKEQERLLLDNQGVYTGAGVGQRRLRCCTCEPCRGAQDQVLTTLKITESRSVPILTEFSNSNSNLCHSQMQQQYPSQSATNLRVVIVQQEVNNIQTETAGDSSSSSYP